MTSEDREFCAFQVARLAGLDKWPRNNEAKAALIDAAQAFGTRELLRRFVDDHLKTEVVCPKPAVLYRVARDTAPSKPTPPIKCFVCYDDGLKLAKFLVTWHDGKRYPRQITDEEERVLLAKDQETPFLAIGKQMIYDTSMPCDCKKQPGA